MTTLEQNENWVQASRRYGERVRQMSANAEDGTIRSVSSWCDFDLLGQSDTSYKKTFPFDGLYLDETHKALGSAPLGRNGVSFHIDLQIDGFLSRAEAMKLYEIARFTKGDILELGTHKGLSTSILASGLRTRGSGHLWTIDIEPAFSAAAEQSLTQLSLNSWSTFLVGDAPAVIEELIAAGHRFDFIFIDHWHGYEATAAAIGILPAALITGGFVLFHDFNDSDNAKPDHPHKVYPAIIDHLATDPRFEFYGIYSSAALFRKVG